jgi:hypothetical protein
MKTDLTPARVAECKQLIAELVMSKNRAEHKFFSQVKAEVIQEETRLQAIEEAAKGRVDIEFQTNLPHLHNLQARVTEAEYAATLAQDTVEVMVKTFLEGEDGNPSS